MKLCSTETAAIQWKHVKLQAPAGQPQNGVGVVGARGSHTPAAKTSDARIVRVNTSGIFKASTRKRTFYWHAVLLRMSLCIASVLPRGPRGSDRCNYWRSEARTYIKERGPGSGEGVVNILGAGDVALSVLLGSCCTQRLEY